MAWTIFWACDMDNKVILTHISLASLFLAKIAKLDQTPQNAASDQVLHMIAYRNFLKNLNKKGKIAPNNNKIGNGLVQLIRMG